MNHFLVGVVALFGALQLGNRADAADPEIGIGSPAPKFEVKQFLKGAPIKQLDKGTTYVIEFWATWCGPCKATIPHLTELQKKFKNVVFVGVAVWEENQKMVAPFVEEMGDKMDYRVAIDLVPPGGEPDDGKMARNWMKAADQSGIPTAFIVNKDGVIAWIGHPGEIEKTLEKVIAGKWDVAAAARRTKAIREIEARLEKAQDEKPAALVAFLDEKFKADPELEDTFSLDKFIFMLRIPDAPSRARALEFGARLVNGRAADEPNVLATISREILRSGSEELNDQKMLALGIKAAERADELTKQKSPRAASILAQAYFAGGQKAKAIAALKRSIVLFKASDDVDPEQIEMLQKRLAEYEKKN